MAPNARQNLQPHSDRKEKMRGFRKISGHLQQVKHIQSLTLLNASGSGLQVGSRSSTAKMFSGLKLLATPSASRTLRPEIRVFASEHELETDFFRIVSKEEQSVLDCATVGSGTVCKNDQFHIRDLVQRREGLLRCTGTT